jgi:hypothetical protein
MKFFSQTCHFPEPTNMETINALFSQGESQEWVFCLLDWFLGQKGEESYTTKSLPPCIKDEVYFAKKMTMKANNDFDCTMIVDLPRSIERRSDGSTIDVELDEFYTITGCATVSDDTVVFIYTLSQVWHLLFAADVVNEWSALPRVIGDNVFLSLLRHYCGDGVEINLALPQPDFSNLSEPEGYVDDGYDNAPLRLTKYVSL